MRGTQKEQDFPEPEDKATEEKEKGEPETRKEYRRERDERKKIKVSGRAEMTNKERMTGN